MYTCTCVHIYVHIHVYTYIYKYVHMYTQDGEWATAHEDTRFRGQAACIESDFTTEKSDSSICYRLFWL